MNGVHDNNNNQSMDLQCLPSLCRGIYNRVAQKVGCDPSYVSRVARGERRSETVVGSFARGDTGNVGEGQRRRG